ncbi:MAG: response regulator [Acidobacteria bacterium]|nr:MAG: response regulator [Acidobacteriota bacterium]REK07870.1 MAG: response regulator [Acidobacteriota bacterium]
MTPGGIRLRLLIVDDDEVDRKGLRRGFRQLGMEECIVEARDGIEALELLRGERPGLDPRLPRLVLLDLNMPRMNGLEMLAELRRDRAIADTVVFVLTTSADQSDVRAALKLGVAGYLVKSNLRDEFGRVAQMIARQATELSPTGESSADGTAEATAPGGSTGASTESGGPP